MASENMLSVDEARKFEGETVEMSLKMHAWAAELRRKAWVPRAMFLATKAETAAWTLDVAAKEAKDFIEKKSDEPKAAN